MKKIFLSSVSILLLMALPLRAATGKSELQFGKTQLSFPQQFAFTPLPSIGAMIGESERSTVTVLVKSTVLPHYTVASAQKIWNQNLEISGMKSHPGSCVQRKKSVHCQQANQKKQIAMVFSSKQIVTVQQKAKGAKLSPKDHIQISERE